MSKSPFKHTMTHPHTATILLYVDAYT